MSMSMSMFDLSDRTARAQPRGRVGAAGVRVNAVSPGLIRTPLAEALLADEAFMARRQQATPLRRVGEPHEIAGVIVMLAGRAGGFITGHNLIVDGGTTIGDGS